MDGHAKLDGHLSKNLDESKDKSGRSKSFKVDGSRILKSESGVSKSVKVDGLKILNSESRRFGSTKVDGPDV